MFLKTTDRQYRFLNLDDNRKNIVELHYFESSHLSRPNNPLRWHMPVGIRVDRYNPHIHSASNHNNFIRIHSIIHQSDISSIGRPSPIGANMRTIQSVFPNIGKFYTCVLI